MVRVSVLINNRDNAPFLRECVESVLGQTRQAEEVIVFDDGSVDGSGEILAGYGAAIRVLKGTGGDGTPMQNQGRAIEAAFAASTGEFIFLLDADDAYGPRHVAEYLRAFERSGNVIMVQAPLWKIDADGHGLGCEYDERRHATDYLKHIYATHEVNIYYPTSSLAFRRRYLEARLPLADDDGLALWPDARLALIAPHFGDVVTLEEPQTFWRRHPRSHTVASKVSVYEQVRMNRVYYNRFCARAGLPLVRSWRSPQHLKRWLRHICPPRLLDSYQFLTGGARRPPARGLNG
ncbi:MAG TPA: glycosyltransferase [Opitutus sp.]|nr:glycosyltransferase [Opitutus sp.]